MPFLIYTYIKAHKDSNYWFIFLISGGFNLNGNI